ncbi:MAG: electron transport complex subunit RsxC [Lentisphaerae bacterium]|nr:electron transport complex subunit RsxC [Lentisphaerota bacterium]
MSASKPKLSPNVGVHPAYHKEATSAKPIEVMPLPPLLRVSMSQHLGKPALPVVKKGDTVLRGQVIGEAAGFVSAAVHAPTSGAVKDVAEAPTAGGIMALAVDIAPDGRDAWAPAVEENRRKRADLLARLRDDPAAARKEVVAAVADAGIAGMGGAGFPTHVKLSPPPDKPIETLIINGAECEPYLTADDRLMVERAAEIWQGALIIQAALGAKRVRVAVENNKPRAAAAMGAAVADSAGDCAVVMLETMYPQGAEKQQILAILGREVPSGGLPMDVGVVVENVGTALAVRDAVVNGRPLTERVTTVTGPCVAEPKNVLARLGTLYSDLVAFCGGFARPPCKIVSGGPMMGLAQSGLDVSTAKTTSGLVALPRELVGAFVSMPCISCGRCVEACPSGLMPCELSQMLEAEDYEAAAGCNVADCIECGCCAYVCPARRPLVQHMRRGKAWVAAQRRKP